MTATLKTRTSPRSVPPVRSFFRDDAAERDRQKRGSMAKKSAELQAKAAEAEVPPVSPERIIEWMKERSKEHRAKIRQLIMLEVKRLGYTSGTRQGSALWLKAQNTIVSNLIAFEVDLDDIDLSECESEVSE